VSGKKSEHSCVTAEQLLKKTSNLYEAIVAISKEARRVNLISQTWGGEEKPVTRALINFAEGKVEYIVEGEVATPQISKTAKKKRGKKGK